MVSAISRNIQIIRERIERAASGVGRSGGDVSLVAVTKTRSVEEMIEAAGCGVDALAENRVQEALSKHEEWPPEIVIPWHLVGHLQKNKARKAAGIFECIHSVDSIQLAKTLEAILHPVGGGIRILVEVNVGFDPDKNGVLPADLPFLVEDILSNCHTLELCGLMTVPPLGLDEKMTRKLFASLRKLNEETACRFAVSLPELSMGMSGDFEYAVMEGSTMVRIGSAIFGERQK
ncbi:MAG TPA: YggS family pyridoxal phosphate-dependent enzyme [Synergistetes bacterium]|nr:YggS family pyridoxal phosphate-dependent enzyme [Synergistota bacterium]